MCGIRVPYVVLGCIISIVNGIACVKGSQVVSMYHVCYMLPSVVSGYQCCVSCHMWYQSASCGIMCLRLVSGTQISGSETLTTIES